MQSMDVKATNLNAEGDASTLADAPDELIAELHGVLKRHGGRWMRSDGMPPSEYSATAGEQPCGRYSPLHRLCAGLPGQLQGVHRPAA